MAESEKIHRQNLRQAMAAAQQDPAIRAVFDKFKDRKQPVLPLDSGLTKKQVLLLMEALEAHRVLRNTEPEDADELTTNLEEFSKGAQQRYRQHFLNLRSLLEDEKAHFTRNSDKQLLLELSGYVTDPLERKDLDSEAVNSLRTLIESKVLVPVGTKSHGSLRVYGRQ